MKLCNYCETTLPEDANICTQCHMVLGDKRTIGNVAIATETQDATIQGWSAPVEVKEEHNNGVAVIPNPETPIPDMAMIEDLPTLANDTLESPGSSPTLQDKNMSDEPTMLIEQDADVITDDPTPPLSIVNEAEAITGDLQPTLAAELDAETITDDPTPILPDARDAGVGAASNAVTPALLMERDAETITDDPTPAPLMGHTVETITDDPTPAALMEQEAVEITDDPRPVLEHQSDTAIIRADAPIPVTDPDLSIATVDALATLTDHDDDPTPGNGYLPEYVEESDSLAVMELPGTGAETSSHNGYAIPAPLYPDYGKAATTPPTPLYEDYKKASSAATASPPLVPGKTSAGSTQLWSWRGLLAIALCLLIILSSIGLFISRKAQTGGSNLHTSAKLDVITQSLTSKVVKGHKIILAAEIANKGTQALRWTADTSKTAWLSMDKNKLSGTIAAGAPQQLIYARADATALDVGNFTGAIQLHSNGGNSSIQVMLNVLPATGNAQPIMTVDSTTLDFGSLSQGQQATQTVNIGNAGTATLTWKADAGKLPWITLTPTAGTILAGGYPQLLTITIQTTNLKTGFTPANINFTSNASAPQPPLKITVNVTAANGNALTISASPGSFTNGCLNCTILLSASQSGTGAPTSVQWSTSGAGVPGITFSPSAGTLLAGQSTSVTVTVPNTTCPASANFTFAGAANTFSVLWSCTPTPTPNAVLTVSPTSLTNCYTCIVYLSPAAGSQSSLKWTSSSNGINGISINPSQGTVAAGNSQAVTITVPNTNCPANANSATFTFNGQGSGNSASVAWSCTAPTPQTPQLSVSPNTLNSSQCAKNGDGTYNCTVTLSENPAGNLSWSTSTSVGGTFSQQSGTFTPGNTSTQITLSSIPCSSQGTNGTFTFSATGSNSASVNWSCTAPPTVTPPPGPTPPTPTIDTTSLSQNSSNCQPNTDGTYTCFVIIGESFQGTLSWNGSDSRGLAVSPSNGTLTPGNPTAKVFLNLIPCDGQSDTLTIATSTGNVSANWNCSPPPDPTPTPPTPTPTVVPAMLSFSTLNYQDASGCSYAAGSGWTCTETLSVNSDATQNLTWNVSASNPDIQFSSTGSTMSAGQSLSLTITIPDRFCPVSAFFLFAATNQGNGVQVNWNCNAVLADSWQGCTTLDNGATYLCNINLFLAPGSQGKMSWDMSTTASGDKIIPYNNGTLASNGSDLITVQTGCYDTITIVGHGGSSGSGNTIPPINWACK